MRELSSVTFEHMRGYWARRPEEDPSGFEHGSYSVNWDWDDLMGES